MTVFVGEDALSSLLSEMKGDVGGSLNLTGMVLKLLSVDGTELASVTIPEQSTDVSGKQDLITGAATTITDDDLTASRALVSNASGKVAVSGVTSTELGYLDGVTSAIQTQLDGKAASSHNHGAGNITSGTLGVARGGTGISSPTAGSYLVGNGSSALTLKTPAQVLSDIGAAASSHNHAAGDINSGTLAVARLPTVTVAKGGTGSTSLTSGSYLIGNGTSAVSLKTPAQVLSDIGAASSGHTHTAADVGAAASSHTHSAYLPKAGGTMTGELVMNGKHERLKNVSIDPDIVPESFLWGDSRVIFTDTNGDTHVQLVEVQTNTGSIGFMVYVQRDVGGTSKTTNFQLLVDASGNPVVSVSNNAPWRAALGINPVQLYSNTGNGSNAAVTLSASVASYTRVKIYFKDNNKRKQSCCEFYGLAASDVFDLYCIEASSATTSYVRRTRYTVSSNGKTLTPSLGGNFGVNHSTKTIGAATTTATNELYIYRVEGYGY